MVIVSVVFYIFVSGDRRDRDGVVVLDYAL